LKQWLDFSDKKGLQLWSDFHQIQAKTSLKQRLDFLVKNGFHLSSDFLQIQVKKSLKQRWDFSDRKRTATMVSFA